MTNESWQRVEGMIIAEDLDSKKLTDYVSGRNVVAQLEWFPNSPGMVGIRVAVSGDHVGILTAKKPDIHAGPTFIDFIEELADKFSAEVMIGDMGVDRLPEGVTPDQLAPAEQASDGPMRIVEISETPASAIPLLAAFEGVDIADLELSAGKRALLAEIPDSAGSWNFGDVPLISLVADGDSFQVFLIEDDDPETMVTYNWGMEEVTIPGKRGKDPQALQLAHQLVGSDDDIRAICGAIPGADVEAAIASTRLRGPEAVSAFVSALGLPAHVAEYLLGVRELGALPNALYHQARGISNAIGRSVDLLLREREQEWDLWKAYTSLVVRRPQLLTLISSTEAVTGAALIAISRKRDGRRSWARRFGTLAGVVLVINSLAELSLAKLVRLREERHAQRYEQQHGPHVHAED